MEDVLEVYHRPADPKRPLICLDEASVQLLGEVREPLPLRPGAPFCVDSEYKREGVESYFMLMAPLLGWRQVEVTGTRTKADYAHVLKRLDEKFPKAEKIVVVQDNLNTHRAATLYEIFAPQEARRLVERFEFHYCFAPPHGAHPFGAACGWLSRSARLAQAWELAQHGGDRTGHLETPMPGATHRHPHRTQHANQLMADGAQSSCFALRLAVHHGGCSHQTQTAIPNFLSLTYH